MSGHQTIGTLQHHVLPPPATLFPIFKFEIASIGDEISVPHSTRISLALAAKVFGLAGETIREITRGVENEVGIMKEVEEHRDAVGGKKASRLGPLAIEVLVRGVERQGEQAPVLPFKGLLRSFVVPNSRRPASFENKNQIFIKMSLRACLFARSYLQNISTGCSLRAFHVVEGPFSSGSVPRFQFNLLQILDKKGLNDGYPFFELPFLIIRNVVHCVIDLGRRFGHIYPPEKAILGHTVSNLQKQGSSWRATKHALRFPQPFRALDC